MSVFSNFLSCCGRKNEKENEVNINENEKKDEKEEIENSKIQNENISKSKNSNSNTNTKNSNSNNDSNKKYSFIISASSNRTEKIPQKNINNDVNIIYSKDKIEEIEKSNDNFSSSSKNSISESTIKKNNKNIISKCNFFKNNNSFDNNNKSISQISLDNSISSHSSSSIKNLTQIFTTEDNYSYGRKISKKSKSTYEILNQKKKKNKEINIDFDNIVLDEEIELAPKLILSEINNSHLFNGKKIHIDASGCHEGLRQKRDGMTFFGLNETEKDEIVNDVIINLYKDIKLTKLFVIYYDRKRAHYYIQNLNSEIKENKFLMYVRIYNDYYLNCDDNFNKYLILGQNLISFNIDSNNNLNIKIFDDNKKEFHHNKYKEYKFDTTYNHISIGRDNCTITLDNSHLSRIHSTFFFNNYSNKWILCDGNGKGKYSTHGTWFILNGNKFELSSSLTNYEVKIGDQLFNIKIEEE
jgi:hypothetical protein